MILDGESRCRQIPGGVRRTRFKTGAETNHLQADGGGTIIPRAISSKLRQGDGTSLLRPIHPDLDRTPLLLSPTRRRRTYKLSPKLNSRSLNPTINLDLNSTLRSKLLVINNYTNLTNKHLNINNNLDRTNLTPNPHTQHRSELKARAGTIMPHLHLNFPVSPVFLTRIKATLTMDRQADGERQRQRLLQCRFRQGYHRPEETGRSRSKILTKSSPHHRLLAGTPRPETNIKIYIKPRPSSNRPRHNFLTPTPSLKEHLPTGTLLRRTSRDGPGRWTKLLLLEPPVVSPRLMGWM